MHRHASFFKPFLLWITLMAAVEYLLRKAKHALTPCRNVASID